MKAESPNPMPFDVEAALNALPLVDVPDLKGPVLAQLANRRPARRQRFPKLAFGLALGCAAALLLAFVVRQAAPAQNLTAATMAPRGASGWPVVNRVEAQGGAVTVRRMGDRFAFFLEVPGHGTPALHWDTTQWELLDPAANPVILKHLTGNSGVSLWADGRRLMEVPVPMTP